MEQKAKGELAIMVEVIAKALVDQSDQVSVTEVQGENTTVIELRVAKSDIGKIIGKEGKRRKQFGLFFLVPRPKLSVEPFLKS